VRWTAIDAHLLPRPIRIEYKASTSDTWQAITANGLANTGRYDWRLPDSLSGDLDLRVVAVDQGDHETASESKMVEVMVVSSSGRKVGQEPTARNHERAVRISEENRSTSAATRQRADRYYSEGLTLRDRGDYRQGIARMREAVRLDPNMTAAFVEMAVMLYRIGEFDRSLSAFDIALQQQPTMRGALVGAAMVYRQKRDYDRASQNLRTVLRYNPNDAEAWMYLGDVAVFRGDDSAASEYYTRAKEIDPTATQVVEDAEHRLALMAEVSKPNRAGGGS
jgi:Flp pilus assembly protein TadD